MACNCREQWKTCVQSSNWMIIMSKCIDSIHNQPWRAYKIWCNKMFFFTIYIVQLLFKYYLSMCPGTRPRLSMPDEGHSFLCPCCEAPSMHAKRSKENGVIMAKLPRCNPQHHESHILCCGLYNMVWYQSQM
jgi:hypothetical protein